jgi:hypothetical protein
MGKGTSVPPLSARDVKRADLGINVHPFGWAAVDEGPVLAGLAVVREGPAKFCHNAARKSLMVLSRLLQWARLTSINPHAASA